jgi:hypothetical protein
MRQPGCDRSFVAPSVTGHSPLACNVHERPLLCAYIGSLRAWKNEVSVLSTIQNSLHHCIF